MLVDAGQAASKTSFNKSIRQSGLTTLTADMTKIYLRTCRDKARTDISDAG